MAWSPCFAALADARSVLARFGHSAVALDARDTVRTELVVVYGGVGAWPEQPEQQTALADMLVLQVGREGEGH
jgi:hypothetical protein